MFFVLNSYNIILLFSEKYFFEIFKSFAKNNLNNIITIKIINLYFKKEYFSEIFNIFLKIIIILNNILNNIKN